MNKKFVITIVLLALLSVCFSPSYALTRKIVEQSPHQFTYSIEPNWKSGPITRKDFQLYFSLFNDDSDSVVLEEVRINFPSSLNYKRRPHDNVPMVRPRGTAVDLKTNRIVIDYDERLNGFSSDGEIDSKTIFSHFYVEEGDAATSPIMFTVFWSKPGSDQTRRFTLKKELSINPSVKSKVRSDITDTSKKEVRSGTAPSGSWHPSPETSNESDTWTDINLTPREIYRHWYSALVTNLNDTQARAMRKSLGEEGRSKVELEVLKNLLDKKLNTKSSGDNQNSKSSTKSTATEENNT